MKASSSHSTKRTNKTNHLIPPKVRNTLNE